MKQFQLLTAALLISFCALSVAARARPRVLVMPVEPSLDDFPTYRDYVPIDDVSVSFETVNDGWVEGRVYLQSWASFVGIIDSSTATYIEPVDGTTPIAGGHAFNAGWGVLVTVTGWDGLIVLSPFGNFVQGEPYINDDEVATVRIVNQRGRLIYYLNGTLVFSQAASGLETRDLRAFYFGPVDNALIGIPLQTYPCRFCLAPDRRRWY